MKRVYKIFVWIVFISFIVVIYIFFGVKQLIVNVLILNLVVYALRSILIDVFQSLIKILLVRYIIMIIINIIWILFPFWLIFIISPIYFVAIISFLVVAISLTFQNIINNIASGVMLLSSGGLEAGDLVKFNEVDGIVKEITLNNLKLLDFDGSITYIPNKTAFNSSVVRYTHTPIRKETKIEISDVVKKLKKIITLEKKITRYIMVVELLGSVDTKGLETLLNPILGKYEPIFGTKPYYYANNTVSGNRLSITIQIITEDPNLILAYSNPLLKEILYKIYEKEINCGWNNNELDGG